MVNFSKCSNDLGWYIRGVHFLYFFIFGWAIPFTLSLKIPVLPHLYFVVCWIITLRTDWHSAFGMDNIQSRYISLALTRSIHFSYSCFHLMKIVIWHMFQSLYCQGWCFIKWFLNPPQGLSCLSQLSRYT